MRKIFILLTGLCLPFIKTVAKDQVTPTDTYRATELVDKPVSGESYLIYSAASAEVTGQGNRTGFIYEEGGALKRDVSNAAPKDILLGQGRNAVFTVTGDDTNGYSFKTIGGKYIGKSQGNGQTFSLSDTEIKWTVNDGPKYNSKFPAKSWAVHIDNMYWNGNANTGSAANAFVSWTDGHPYHFYKYEVIPFGNSTSTQPESLTAYPGKENVGLGTVEVFVAGKTEPVSLKGVGLNITDGSDVVQEVRVYVSAGNKDEFLAGTLKNGTWEASDWTATFTGDANLRFEASIKKDATVPATVTYSITKVNLDGEWKNVNDPLTTNISVFAYEGNRAAHFSGMSYMKVDQKLPEQFTFSAWICQDDVPANRAGGGGGTIISWGTKNFDGGVYTLDTRNATLTFGIWDQASNKWNAVNHSGMPVKQWVHVALTRKGSQYTIYFNGEQVGQETITQAPKDYMCHIGLNNSGGKMVSYFYGKMDEVVLLNRVCTNDEIKKLMRENSLAMSDDAEFYFPFEQPWNAYKDLGKKEREVETKSMAVTDEDNQFAVEYKYTVPFGQLAFKSLAVTQPETLTAGYGELHVNLGTVDINTTGVKGSIKLQGTSMNITSTPEAFENVKVYISTPLDNYASEKLVATLDMENEWKTEKLDTALQGEARLRFVADICNTVDTSKVTSYALDKVMIDGKWHSANVTATDVKYEANRVFKPVELKDGLVRNPAMGWVLYLDGFGQMNEADKTIPDCNKGVHYPELFWETFDKCGATEAATIFYARAPWSFFEPTEGNYAWRDKESNCYKLIQGALERGMRLAFRIYVDSKDSYTQATPEYVKTAGAEGIIKDRWTPYADDPVFLAKFRKFLAEFAKDFNDPAHVDYIDGQPLGNWGEGHGIPLKTWNLGRTLDEISKYYRESFPDVLLGGCEGGSTKGHSVGLVSGTGVVKYDIRRRDSFGMKNYYGGGDRTDYSNYVLNKQVPLMAENGWNYFGHRSDDAAFQAYTGGAGCRFENVKEMMEYTLYTDVLPSRANTFDLRVPEDAEQWMRYPQYVDDFINRGGYRFVPERISFAHEVTMGGEIVVDYSFANRGVGVLPNTSPAYNNKYKLCYALIDSENKVSHIFVSKVNPGLWYNTAPAAGKEILALGDSVQTGTYKLAFAIVDNTGKAPDIRFAVENPTLVSDRWYVAGEIDVHDAATGIVSPTEKPHISGKGIYTVSGICISETCTEEQIYNLPAGIYIINGKKIVK